MLDPNQLVHKGPENAYFHTFNTQIRVEVFVRHTQSVKYGFKHLVVSATYLKPP